MADVNGLFWNSNNGDRRYNADSLSEWLRKFFTTGVFNGEMQVTPVSGMGINVATGYANIQGKVRNFDTETSFTVPTANSTYPRIDTVVVQADYTNRNISLVYVQGAYSGNSPEPQAPVRDTGLYQIVLAQIYVAAGATEITAANITDTRSDSDLCGWVTGTVEGVPVEQIVAQMTAQFMEFFERMKDQLDGDAAGHLQLEIDELISSLSALVLKTDTLVGNFAQIESATAAEAHSVGDYIVYNNQLYKVIAAISVGDTLEVGTNIESTSAGAELESINKSLMPKLSYTSKTALVGYFPKHPTQSTTNSYTFTEDGFVYLYGIRGNGFGYTLKVNIDGEDWYNFPAEQNYATASLLFPVYKGQTMRIYTDSAGETWGVLTVDFIK